MKNLTEKGPSEGFLPHTRDRAGQRRRYRKHQQPPQQRIAILLTALGIRNRDIAKALQVSPATVSRLIAGQEEAMLKVYQKLEARLILDAAIAPYEAFANYMMARASGQGAKRRKGDR